MKNVLQKIKCIKLFDRGSRSSFTINSYAMTEVTSVSSFDTKVVFLCGSCELCATIAQTRGHISLLCLPCVHSTHVFDTRATRTFGIFLILQFREEKRSSCSIVHTLLQLRCMYGIVNSSTQSHVGQLDRTKDFNASAK